MIALAPEDKVIVPSNILARDSAEDIEHTARCLIVNARETLIDVESKKYTEEQVRAAVVGLDCALALVEKLAGRAP